MDSDEPVSMKMFTEQMANVVKFMEAMAAESERNQKQREAELGTITNLSQRTENLESSVNKILTYLENPQQGGQQVQQTEPRGKFNLSELTTALREIATAAREANILPGGEPSELQRWGMAAAETAQREALLSIKRQVRSGMRRGLVDRPTVESIVDETLDKSFGGAGHEPVL